MAKRGLAAYLLKIVLAPLFICGPFMLPAQQTENEIETLLDHAHQIMDAKTDSAFIIGQNCLAAALKLNDKKGEGVAYTIIGRVYRRKGKYLEAIENQVKALKIFEKINDPIKIASASNNIAILYVLLKDYKKVIEYEEYGLKALARAQNISKADSVRFVNMNNQLGAASFEMGKLDEAFNYFKKALQYAQSIGNRDGESTSLENISKVYNIRKQYKKALEYALKGYEIELEINDPVYIGYSLGGIGDIYGEMGQYEKALPYFKKMSHLADSTGFLELKKSSLKDFAEVYSKLNDYKKAFYYQEQYIALNDSTLNIETNGKIGEIETQYQFEKKQQENEFLKQQNSLQQTNLQQARFQKQWLAAGLIIFIVLSGIIIFFLIKGYNRNRQLKNLVEEKNNIMGVLSHDMRSPLVKINNAVELQQSTGTSDFVPIKNIVDEGLTMLSNILDVNYLEGTPAKPRPAEIDILELAQLCMEENLDNANRKQITMQLDINMDTIIIYSDRIMLKRILDNLVSNAIKYSYPNSQVKISINSEGDKKIIISVADTGQGIREEEREKLFTKYAKLSAKPTAGETSTGLGLYISAWLTQLLKGRIWCESKFNTGSTFYVELPIAIVEANNKMVAV